MKNLFFCFLAIFAIFMVPAFAQVKPEDFLLQFGYLKNKTGTGRSDDTTPEEMQQAILHFQSFNGLPQTGVFDAETSKKMRSPRCGVTDNTGDGEMAKYSIVSKWPENFVTWKINKYSRTSKLSQAEQKHAISRGLNRWAKVTPLAFQETGDNPNIDISFERLEHDDGYKFDGRGMVLAHAFFPENGDTHFDDDELWINGNGPGTDLETVAAHEFGHALGLGHSNNPSSLMAPYYQIFPDSFTLHWDDVAGIQRLYGKKPVPVTTTTDATTTTSPTTTTTSTTTPTTTIPTTTIPTTTTPTTTTTSTTTSTTTTTRRTPPTTPTPPSGRGFCNHSYRSINAAMRISGNDIVFVDNYDVIDGRYGQKMAIQRLFPGGPNVVQAAVYSAQNRKVFLFNDEHVWVFTLNSNRQFELSRNSPKQISNDRVHKPESAIRFNYYGSERIFLIKNGYFVEFMPYYESVNPGLGYPTSVFFPNIPSTIDASISSYDAIHFIVKNKAYKMPNRSRTVHRRGKPVTMAFKKCRN